MGVVRLSGPAAGRGEGGGAGSAFVNAGTEGRVHGWPSVSRNVFVNTRSVPAFTAACRAGQAGRSRGAPGERPTGLASGTVPDPCPT